MFGIFRPGDRVRAARGSGPVMEVKGYDDRDQVICSWYVAYRGWMRKTFTEQALQRIRRGRTSSR